MLTGTTEGDASKRGVRCRFGAGKEPHSETRPENPAPMCWDISFVLPRSIKYWYETIPACDAANAIANLPIISGNAKTLNSATENDLLDETNMTEHQYM